MPSYDVLVTQDITQSTTIRVEADDPDQAAEKALSKARAKGYELDWTLSDDPCSDPYLGDDEEDVQLVDSDECGQCEGTGRTQSCDMSMEDEECPVCDGSGKLPVEDEPCPVNRRPKSTCPDGCSHGT